MSGQGCKMNITISGNDVYGTYSYNKYDKPLTLQGTMSGNFVQLDEIDKYGEVTGSLNGTVSGNTFKGTHLRYQTMRESSFSFTVQ